MWKTAQAPEILSATNVTQDAGGTVPATLSLTLGTPASFGAFTPGVSGLHASTTANVISTAGDATLTGRRPELAPPRATWSTARSRCPQPLQAARGGTFAPVGGSAAHA